MRAGILDLNDRYRELLSNDLGAIGGLLFDIGSGRYPAPPLEDDATAADDWLGMVEFIRAHDRDIFIEMNPRIWGPAQFCLDQAQPLLQAFIGEALHDKPLRFTHQQQRPQRRMYFWLDGLLGTISTGESPTWHSTKRSLVLIIVRNLFCDIYLRKDSWRCFLHDFWTHLKKRVLR